ncbi:hypothetical protein ABOM_005484 [Aspergillus bombycis]|uniref:Ricin B lectin domain-containing protein n=1 Tax=Aspergillus bombycis TaxID=109264 RepID=A0A1F8A272_9EURO|nr:hypothetical protein ABOM_005484 [Aspergillus bombycis]OGM45824.1 hypothetical protein ABOM_005484 [Aspergillus bombycis]
MSVNNLLRVSIESKHYPGNFLRLDGRGLTQNAGGVVNVQDYVGKYETLIIINHPEDNTFSILSAEFPNIYLRMDGGNVKPGQRYGSGTGVVNCQVGSRSYEKFRFVDQEDGSKAIVSVRFPDAYLRMENEKKEGGSGGGGTVNCQSYVGTLEKFIIHVV